MNYKRFFQNTLLITLSFAIGYYAFFGPQGIVTYCTLSQDMEQDKRNIEILKKNINQLKQTINNHHASEFELEKIARYDFCMGYTNELIYVLAKT